MSDLDLKTLLAPKSEAERHERMVSLIGEVVDLRERLREAEATLKAQGDWRLDAYQVAVERNRAQARVKQLERVRFLDDVLAAQVRAMLALVATGGDVRKANLADRLFTDRLQDTLNERDAAMEGK